MIKVVARYIITCDICGESLLGVDEGLPSGWGALAPTHANDPELHICPGCCGVYAFINSRAITTRWVMSWKTGEPSPWKAEVSGG